MFFYPGAKYNLHTVTAFPCKCRMPTGLGVVLGDFVGYFYLVCFGFLVLGSIWDWSGGLGVLFGFLVFKYY